RAAHLRVRPDAGGWHGRDQARLLLARRSGRLRYPDGPGAGARRREAPARGRATGRPLGPGPARRGPDAGAPASRILDELNRAAVSLARQATRRPGWPAP